MYNVLFVVSGDTYFYSYDNDILYLTKQGLTKNRLHARNFKTLKGAKIAATKYARRKINLNLVYTIEIEKIY